MADFIFFWCFYNKQFAGCKMRTIYRDLEQVFDCCCWVVCSFPSRPLLLVSQVVCVRARARVISRPRVSLLCSQRGCPGNVFFHHLSALVLGQGQGATWGFLPRNTKECTTLMSNNSSTLDYGCQKVAATSSLWCASSRTDQVPPHLFTSCNEIAGYHLQKNYTCK